MILYLYPTNWQTIARDIKDACGWRCQACERQCRRPGEFFLGWQYELTLAHYWHEYDTPTAFVVALCSECHLRHDAPFAWPARRRAARARQQRAGQLALIL